MHAEVRLVNNFFTLLRRRTPVWAYAQQTGKLEEIPTVLPNKHTYRNKNTHRKDLPNSIKVPTGIKVPDNCKITGINV